MPGWLTHLRVAEAIIDKIDFSLDFEKYYIGRIATDCGVVRFDENGKKYYEPPRYISHWTDNIPDWDAAIHFERFYNTYLRNETDPSKKSFYLGYYSHLLTDAIWIELVSRPVIENFKPDYYNKIVRNKFRADWYQTEIDFLQKNPNYYPLEILKSVNEFDISIYLDYASKQKIQDNLNQVAKAYNLSNIDIKTEYSYFTPKAYETVMLIIKKVAKMNLLSR